MRNFRTLFIVVLMGSLWGLCESGIGEILYKNQISHASSILFACGLLTLSIAWVMQPSVGISLIIGVIACFFRIVNAPPFFEHLRGIITLALAFEIVMFILKRVHRFSMFHKLFAGVFVAYLGHILFIVFATYIVPSESWVVGGAPKIFKHILVDGSLAALASLIALPLGFYIGQQKLINERIMSFVLSHRLISYSGVAMIWIGGHFI